MSLISFNRGTELLFGILAGLCVLVDSIQVTYSENDSDNILIERPVTIQPGGATCGAADKSNVTYLNYYNPALGLNSEGGEPSLIRCVTTCPKTYPQTYSKIRKGSTYELGVPGCTEVPLLLRDSSPGNTTPLPPSRRRKRQTASKCGLSSMKPQGGRETHTLWVNPSPGHKTGTLISTQIAIASAVNAISLDLRQGSLVLRARGNAREYRQVNVSSGVWTFIALQVSGMSSQEASIAVFVNGSLLLEPIYLYLQPSRFRRQTEDGGMFRDQPVFWGISGQPYFENTGCQVSVVSECQSIGYSAFVRLTRGDLLSAESGTTDALREVRNQCPNTSKLLSTLYICSSLLPTCAASGAPLQPCRSLCLEYTKTCNYEQNLILGARSCSKLPEKNCVDSNFLPEFGTFRGQMKEVTSYGDQLTQREIIKEYTGELPEMVPMSQCLCPSSISAATSLMCRTVNRQRPVYRLGKEFRVPEAINDRPWPTSNDQTTSWFSAAGVDDVTFTFEFLHRQVILNITMDLGGYSGLWPAETTFQLLDKGQWKDIAYLKENCPATRLLPMTTPRCQGIGTYSWRASVNLVTESRSGVRYGSGGMLSVHPTVVDYLTGTALRVLMRGHFQKQNNFYGITDLRVQGWNRTDDVCECFQGGLTSELITTAPPATPGSSCVHECQCRRGAGDPAETSYTCFPYVGHVMPGYGPESGGTIINITGGYFGTGNVSVIYDDNLPLEILSINDTIISCRTPNRSGQVVLDVPKRLTVRLYEDKDYRQTIVLDPGFVYRGDPEIQSISPLSTFLRGGINQTVVGQSLDSVFEPQMTVTIVHTEGDTQTSYEQPATTCTVLNNTHMVCPSPDIYLPDRFRQLLLGQQTQSNRRKRDTEPTVSNDQRSRTKRSDFRPNINTDDFQFYLGFILDGVEKYNNVSEELPEYGIIDVFTNPVINSWQENGGFKLFQPYKGDEHIQIDGAQMNYGCTEKDYLVEIGDEICTVIGLYTNALQCRPPLQKPSQGLQNRGAPQVTARVGNIAQHIGYLDYHETAWDDPNVKGSILGVLVVVIVVALVVIVIVWWKKRMAQSRAKSEANKYSEAPTPWDMLPANVKAELKPCMKDISCLKLGRKLGEGNFGTVYIGRYTDESKESHSLVAAKTVKDKGTSVKEMMEFLEEATLMKDFHHENVLNLVGVVLDDNRPYVVLPLMENGDLKQFLLNPNNNFMVKDLIDYGYQVAKGMNYLAKLKFIHRDLAARNCMVNKENVVKVADFGLARDIYSNEYYRIENKSRPLPVKWMAPEALDDHRFTSKSDVWSYGILLWELLTRGKKPYAHVDNFEVKQFLKRGNRLEKPEVAPDEVYELMLQCWNMNPVNRPEFAHIVKELELVLSGSEESNVVPKSHSTDGGTSYLNLNRYVDYTTDRQGYEHLHSEQGYLDMAGQVDYLAAAKEIEMEFDGYLAPINSRPSGSSKPSPAPRNNLHNKAKSDYQNVPSVNGSETLNPNGIQLVERKELRDSDSPIYRPTDDDRPVYMNTQFGEA